MRRTFPTTCALLLLAAAAHAAAPPGPQVGPVPDGLRRDWKLSPFYKKHVSAGGLPVLSSAKVSDQALLEARHLIDRMLANRQDVRRALVRNKVRFAVMAPTELTTDVPEHSDLTPKAYWDRRARGLGPTSARPAVSCGEENLLNLPGDRYAAENILVHEFAHAIHLMGLNSVDAKFDKRLREVFARSTGKGLWKKTYAATNHAEYWAEGVQSYFDCNAANNHDHNDVDTRAKLAKYDPELFRLIDETFGKPAWRYVRYDRRHPPARPLPGPGVTLTVVNDTGREATVYWLNEGERVLYRKLAAGERYEQRTFAGHKWQAVIAGRKAPIDLEALTSATWRLR